MELEAWNRPVNRRLVRGLRFCLCRRVPFAQSSYWLINSYPAPGVQIVESATLHYLKAWNKPISSCFLLSLEQILAETRLNVHDSPFPANAQDTVVGTFPAPPDTAGKVYWLVHVRFKLCSVVVYCSVWIRRWITRYYLVILWNELIPRCFFYN